MFHVDHNQEIVFYKTRKGFSKVALVTGTPVVPMYLFGVTSMFSTLTDPFGIMEFISRKSGIPLLLFWGRFGLWLPTRAPQTIVVGKPIPVKKNPNPSPEEIEELHEKIMSETLRLFETHKRSYGWENKTLKFV
eukprot:TRINITY_DN6937_c0_g1_i2.p2 TRINITY_DN6937_c0_g1~~TRINITY_DN6937_c0_g1_i2.p2  ORF type:complete len:134 (-),score=23.31 TRINITY_DN6937_c0_g1_i2:113-514(-)